MTVWLKGPNEVCAPLSTPIGFRTPTIVYCGAGGVTPARSSHSMMHGIVYETFVWDRDLSQSEIDTLETYFLQKYYGTISYPGPAELADISGLAMWMKTDWDYFVAPTGSGLPSVPLVSQWKDAAGTFPELVFTQNLSVSAGAQVFQDPEFAGVIGSGLLFAPARFSLFGNLPGVGRYPWHIFMKVAPADGSAGLTEQQTLWALTTNGAVPEQFVFYNFPTDQGQFVGRDISTGTHSAHAGHIYTPAFNPPDRFPQLWGYSRFNRRFARAQVRNLENTTTLSTGDRLSGNQLWPANVGSPFVTSIGGREDGTPNLPNSFEYGGIIYEILVYHGDLTITGHLDRIFEYLATPTGTP